MKNGPLTPALVDKELTLSKCNYFVDVHLWPIQSVLNPKRWLANFKESEMEHALCLLNSFLYFSDVLVRQLFLAGFHALSNRMRKTDVPFRGVEEPWHTFVDRIVVTPVTGEYPNLSDSGNSFARKAKKLLNVEEERILSHRKTLRLLLDYGPRTVLFVDDFVGSGEQFIKTWHRQIEIDDSISTSFDKVSSTVSGSRFFYVPLLCTEYGYNRIQKKCPNLILSPTHFLSERYSAFSQNSIIWTNQLRGSANEFLRNVSERAGIPDTNGGEDDWRGFHKLGLSLAFPDSVPDSTLPIFHWEENGWKHLIQRR